MSNLYKLDSSISNQIVDSFSVYPVYLYIIILPFVFLTKHKVPIVYLSYLLNLLLDILDKLFHFQLFPKKNKVHKEKDCIHTTVKALYA